MDTLLAHTEGYHQQLLESPEGLDWHHRRGLADKTIRVAKLGWITTPLHPTHANHVGCPVIPYLTPNGVIQIRVRRDGKPKYMPLEHAYPLPQPRVHLYQATNALPSPKRNETVIVEGEYDCLIALQCGLRAVGVSGATAWYDAWCHLFEATNVTIAFDGDDAGVAGAEALAGKFARYRINARIVPLPSGQDITDLYLQGGRDLVRKVLT